MRTVTVCKAPSDWHPGHDWVVTDSVAGFLSAHRTRGEAVRWALRHGMAGSVLSTDGRTTVWRSLARA